MPDENHTARPGIYQIRNLVNGKVYIGSAKNMGYRWRIHRRDLGKQKHHSPHLQKAWEKHGPGGFVFEVLQLVEDVGDLIRLEQEWLDKVRPFDKDRGYNISPTAGSNLGLKRSEEFKKRISEERKASGWKPDAAHRAAVGKAARERVWTPEMCQAISDRLSGKPRPPGFSEKMSVIHKGRKHTPEARANMGNSRRGRKMSDETKAKLAAIHTGRKHTPESRAKMSEAQKNRILSPEAKARIAEAAAATCRKRAFRKWVFRQRVFPFMRGAPGSRNGRAKITPELARKIKAMRDSGMSQQAIADEIGVGQTSVSRVLANRN